MASLLYVFGISENGFLYELFLKYRDTDQTKAFLFFVLGTIICMVLPYLLGSLNFSIIVSKYMFNDDIRKYGSGNAGLTNMQRVYGKKGALLTLGGDILKQIVSIFIGLLIFGENGAYIAGTFCIIGHIAPIYYRFRGGKGVLTAATMVLLIDPVIFLCLFALFAFVVLIFRYISLGSIMAGFVYPALVYYKSKIIHNGEPPSLPSLIFSLFICILLFFMHRKNIERIINNQESRFSFKKKPIKEAEVVEAAKIEPAKKPQTKKNKKK